MRAVVFDRVGDPAEVLQVREVDRPTPGRGEVLVRMIASPVNPSDLMYIRGEYGLRPSFPATPGFEGVGIVEASGGGLLGMLRKGKRVAVINDRRGNWGEYAVTTARQVIPVPADIPDAQAATFFVNPATALALTQHVLKVPQGGWLLQTAAAGALGKMIVRLGRKYGFRTVNVLSQRNWVERQGQKSVINSESVHRDEKKVAELKALGADVVIAGDHDLAERVKEATGTDGVPFAIDPVGGELASRVLKCLAPGGRLIVFGSLSGQPIQFDSRQLIANDLHIESFWLGRWAKQQRILRMLGLFKQVRTLMREGVLTTEAVEEYPMDRVREAVGRAAAGGTKVVIQF